MAHSAGTVQDKVSVPVSSDAPSVGPASVGSCEKSESVIFGHIHEASGTIGPGA